MNRSRLFSGLAAALLASALIPLPSLRAQTPPEQPPASQNTSTPQQTPQPKSPQPPPNVQRNRAPLRPEPLPQHPVARTAAAPPAINVTKPASTQSPAPAAAPAPPAVPAKPYSVSRPTKATGVLADDVAVRSLCLGALKDVMQNRPDKLEKRFEPPRWSWPFTGERHFKDRYVDLMGRYGYVMKATYLGTLDTEVPAGKDKTQLGRRVYYQVVTSKYMDASYALTFTVVARDSSLYLADYGFVETSKAPRKRL
jgi:hypothetical protein